MNLVQGTLDFADADRKAANPTRFQPHPVGIFSSSPNNGDQLKEEGQAKALRKKAAQLYRDNVVEALKIFPVRTRITVEQLTGIVGRPEVFGATCNSVGAIIHGMAKKGLIRKTGRMIKPGRKERHSTEVAEWEVVKYG